MRITGVRTQLYEYDSRRLLGDANSPTGRRKRCELAVMLDTDDGLTGVAIGTPSARQHVHSLADVLTGKDPRGVRGLWKRMVDKVFKGGNEGIANDAIGVLDVAG